MRRIRLLFVLIGCAVVGCNSTLIPFESSRTKEDIAKVKNEGEVRVYPVSENQACELVKGLFQRFGGYVEEDRERGYLVSEREATPSQAGCLMAAWIEPEGDRRSKVTFATKRKRSSQLAAGVTQAELHDGMAALVESGAAEKIPVARNSGPAIVTQEVPAKPVIVVASPEEGQSISTSSVKVKGVCVVATEVDSVECAVDGVSQPRTRGIGGTRKAQEGDSARREVSFEFNVNVREGAHRLVVTVRTKDGQTASKTVEFAKVADLGNAGAAAKGAKLPSIRGFVVGVSSYLDSSLNLKYARKDAASVQALLTGSHVGAASDRVRALLDADATRENVIGALSEFFKRSSKDDLVILYFAMHGMTDPDGGDDIYFLCHDSKVQNLEASALSRNTLEKLIRKCEAERILVIADACHAGILGTSGVGKRDVSSQTPALLKRLSEIEGKGVTFFSASDANEYSQERSDLGHGVFTYFLVRGLEGEADADRDGFVSLQEIEEYTYAKVKERTKGEQHPRMTRPISKDLPLSQTK